MKGILKPVDPHIKAIYKNDEGFGPIHPFIQTLSDLDLIEEIDWDELDCFFSRVNNYFLRRNKSRRKPRKQR